MHSPARRCGAIRSAHRSGAHPRSPTAACSSGRPTVGSAQTTRSPVRGCGRTRSAATSPHRRSWSDRPSISLLSGSFVALDAATGALLWKVNVWGMWGRRRIREGRLRGFGAIEGPRVRHRDGRAPVVSSIGRPGPKHAPLLRTGRVLVGTDAGNVVSLDADTGRIQWTSPASPPSTSAVIRSSPAVDDERVFVATAETTAMSLPSTRRPGRWIGEPTMSPITRRRRPRSRTASCTWGRTTRGSMRSGSGRASCSGRRHGAWRTWSGVSTRAPRSPTGRVYIGCRDGSLYAFGIG
jgi:putative pyrroloquinoline-quinone binding quinoprotein